MPDFHKEFISFCIEQGVLTFGSFVTKSGRVSPYFFNAGLFSTGAALDRLSQFYAKTILASDVSFDMLFGPAYKGIALVAGVSIALARGVADKPRRNLPYAFNRKEIKDHGEGGSLIGAPIAGRVLIVDDVITAGTAVRESIELIRRAGGEVAGVVISMDRMERGQGDFSAVQEVERSFAVPVVAIASLDDLMRFLQDSPEFRQNMTAIIDYRQRYGAAR